MSRSLSWIDASQLASAVSRARAPTTSAPPPAPPERLRFEAVTVPPVATPAPETATVMPSAAVIPPAAVTPPAAPTTPVTPTVAALPPNPDQPIAERIRVLARWVEAELGPRCWYLSDEEGLPLHTAGVSDTQVLAATMLARAFRPLRGVIGKAPLHSASLRFEGGRVMHTMWVPTAWGQVALGLEDPKRGDDAALSAAAQAVQSALQSGAGDEGRTSI